MLDEIGKITCEDSDSKLGIICLITLLEMGNSTKPDEIANLVIREFNAWPRQRKPLKRSDDVKEWVPLSGIVVEGLYTITPNGALESTWLTLGLGRDGLVCLATATGMKCLPKSKVIQAHGLTLHDWHAEILAIRSLNRFLLDECLALISFKKTFSKYVRRRTQEEITETSFQPFTLNDNLLLHMYCSEAPCGDASMELTMAAQKDCTPWELPSPLEKTETPHSLLHGRSFFYSLGSIRGKPSRPDAPLSLSKSCSDKLALKQSTSLLSSIASLLISPEKVYLTSLVIPFSQFSESACERAFSASGRLNLIRERSADHSWSGGYSFQPFRIHSTSLEFEYSRRQPLQHFMRLTSSNLASFSTPDSSGTLIGGTLQGRKQLSLKGAPPMCKRQMWQIAIEIARFTRNEPIISLLCSHKYSDIKYGDLLSDRRKVKNTVRDLLGGDWGKSKWIRNADGDNWTLK